MRTARGRGFLTRRLHRQIAIWSRTLSLSVIVTAVLVTGAVQAAIFTWTGPGGNAFDPTSGNWNVASNWIGGLPPNNDPLTSLDFAGSSATPYISTHNLGLMQASLLNFNSTSTVTHTINAAAGSSLQLVPEVFAGPMIVQNNTGAFTVNVPIAVAAPLTVSYNFGATGTISLGGNLTGTNNLTVSSVGNTPYMLVLGGDNSGYSGNIVVVPANGVDTNGRSLGILSARSPNALGTGNLHLLGSTAVGTPAFATAVLEIGADLDGAGNSTDFSRALGTGAGQINMTGPDEKGAFGFAAVGAVRTVNIGGNAVPTTLVHKQPLLPFGDADGYSLGSPTSDNTLVLMNPIDFLDNANRNLRTIRGVGNVPEGRVMGTLLNSVNNNTYNISGNGGVILDNVSSNAWQAGSVPNPVLVSGGIFLAVSDPASANANSPLGRNNNTITIGSDTGGNSGFGTPLGTINTGVMTYGPGTSGSSATPIITVARNFTIGTGGSGIMTLGGFTADHTRFSGNIDLNGVNTRFTSRTGGRVEFSGVVSNGGLLTVGDTTIEGDATTPGINVQGRGVVVLSGNNTYTGGTQVTHGTLLVNNAAGSGTGTGNVNVQAGATLGGSGRIVPDSFNTVTIAGGGILAPHTTSTGTSALTIGANGLTLGSGALLNFNIGAPGVSDVVNLTGINNNLTLNGASTLNLTNVGGLTVATYPIVTHAGGSVQGGGAISLGTTPGLGFNYAVVQTPSQVELRVTSSAPLRTWTGAASNVWSENAANWSPSNYVNGNQVLFGNTGKPENSNVNIAGTVSPAFITVDNGAGVATYMLGGGTIAGGTGISKTGSGSLVLTGANTYSGVTSVTGGTLRVTNTSGSATGSGLVAISSGATLSGSGTISPTGPTNTVIVGGGSHLAPHLTPTTATTLTIGSNGLTLRDGSILDFNFGAVGNHDRVVLAGAGNALTLEGTTTLNVNSITGFGTGTYPLIDFGGRAGTGSIVLGTLPAGDLIFNILNNPSNIALAVSATKTWSGAVNGTWDTSTPNWTLGGGGSAFSNGDAVRFTDAGGNRTITVAAPVTVASITANSSADYSISGASIGGPAGVSKSGTGTFALNNANTFTGKTSISGGVLSINSAASLGAEPAAPTGDAIEILGSTLRATGSVAFGVNRGVVLGANGATIHVVNAGDTVSVPGLVTGPGSLTVNGSGRLVLGNVNNSFASLGILSISNATVEAKPPVGQNIVMNQTAATGLLGNNTVPVMINGGTLELSTVASAQNITVGRVIQFGPNGGTVDITNTLGGTLGGGVVNGVGGGGGDMRIDLTNAAAPVVFKWNGGQSGISTNDPANGDWAAGSNTLRFATVTGANVNAPVRFELSNGGMLRFRNQEFGTFPSSLTFRGGTAGDITVAGNERGNVGRVQVDGGDFSVAGGMFFEDDVQVNLAGGQRTFDNDITLRGIGSGHPAHVAMTGRATGDANAVPLPGTRHGFQLRIGTPDSPNARTFTIEEGATARFDVRIRTDQPQHYGSDVSSKINIQAGGNLQFAQSWAFGVAGNPPTIADERPVSYVEVMGDIQGNGTVANGESVIEVQLPFKDRNSDSRIGQGRSNLGGVTFRGGAGQEFSSNLIVNGDNSGSGAGLLIRAKGRDTKLYTVNNQQSAAAPAFPTDPVSNVTKLSGNPDSVASAARLAALTGSGGYLTIAANGEAFPFPAGAEWATNVPVGLKVINSNPIDSEVLGDDLSLGGAFQHNINVDVGATLNAGSATLGPATATPNLGLIKGLGAISGTPVFNTGAIVAPGFGLGTLSTLGTPTINGTLQVEINGTAHDQLNVYGHLVLGPSSVLNLPAGNVYDGTTAYIIAGYAGPRTGTFGSTSAIPAGYTLNYGSGMNSYIRLVPANPLNEWLRISGGSWHDPANWSAGAIPNSNADTARLWTGLMIGDVIDIGPSNTTVKALSFRNGAASYNVVTNTTGRLVLSSNAGNASIVFEAGNQKDHGILSGLTFASNTDINLGGNSLSLAGQQDWGGRSVTVNSGTLRYLSSAGVASNTAGASLTIAAAGAVELAGTTSPTSDGTNHVNVTNNGTLKVIANNQAIGTLGGGGDLNVASGATLAAGHIRQDAVNLQGNVTIRPNGSPAGTSAINSLTIAGAQGAWTAKYDVNNNDAVFQSSAATKAADFARLYDQLNSGFAGGVWTGNGITSSTAATNPVADTGLSLVDNALLGAGDFSGQPVNNDSILLKYTYYGDIDMNGQVDGEDLTTFALNFGQTSGMTQVDGDIDFNGRVDGEDLTVFALNFNKGIGNPLSAGAVQAVPEPASLVLAGLAALGALAGAEIRRRQKQRES